MERSSNHRGSQTTSNQLTIWIGTAKPIAFMNQLAICRKDIVEGVTRSLGFSVGNVFAIVLLDQSVGPVLGCLSQRIAPLHGGEGHIFVVVCVVGRSAAGTRFEPGNGVFSWTPALAFGATHQHATAICASGQ